MNCGVATSSLASKCNLKIPPIVHTLRYVTLHLLKAHMDAVVTITGVCDPGTVCEYRLFPSGCSLIIGANPDRIRHSWIAGLMRPS